MSSTARSIFPAAAKVQSLLAGRYRTDHLGSELGNGLGQIVGEEVFVLHHENAAAGQDRLRIGAHHG
jgi:hypothetical protein